MATYWVRSTGGSDANSGLTYALGKATLKSAVTAVAALPTNEGHTINVVNDGVHTMSDFTGLAIIPNTVLGTNYDAGVGMIIQGTDSTGAPAMATVASTDTPDTVRHYWLRITGANYVWVRGIKFDYSSGKDIAIATVRAPISLFTAAGNVRVTDCELWFTSDVGSGVTISTDDLPRMPYTEGGVSGTTVYTYEVYNCVYVNGSLFGAGNSYRVEDYHHNVFLHEAAATVAAQVFSRPTLTGQAAKFYGNTVVQIRHTATFDTVYPCYNSSVNDPASNLSVYDNLFYVDCGSGDTDKVDTHVMSGYVLATAGVAAAVFGNNLLVTGPNMGDISAWDADETRGYASYQLNSEFRAGTAWASCAGSALEVTSDSMASAAFLDVFKSTDDYTWSPGDYDHVLPYDLRPIVGRTMSSTGGVVGALPDAIIVEIPPDTEDPDSQGGHDYLDSYPFFRPLFKATTETMIRIKRNKEWQHTDVRHYLQEHVHDESTSRRVIIAAAGTFTCNLGGVYQSTGLLLETDQTISVVVTHFNGVDNTTFTVTVDDVLVLLQCPVTQLDITNSSASAATVQVAVFD